MKKLLLTAAVAVCAMAANAQDGAPLYATGDFAESNWNPGEPAEFVYADGVYTLTIPEVLNVKVSTAYGDWDTFNTGALGLATPADDAGTYDLVPSDANIIMPWKGEWTLTVAGDLSTITLTTTTPKPEGPLSIYARGGMNGWGVEDAWKFQTTDGVVYVLEGVQIEAGVEFKIADADWGAVNYGSPVPLYLDEPTALEYNGSNITIDYEGEAPSAIDLTFNLDTHMLTISANLSGINAVNAATAPAEYYNLQGVRVANPDNGVYIIKQGNVVKKAYVK